jgi:hypothetical protein
VSLTQTCDGLCRKLPWLALAFLFAGLAAAQESQARGPQSGEQIAVPGKPIASDSGTLSEHNLQWLKTQPPQQQMEFLLQEAVNHDRGATDLIPKYLPIWKGNLQRSERWQNLEQTALYSSDLRVRAAAIEINLAVNGFEKTDDTADHLLQQAETDEKYRGWYEWELGMLANRGVAAQRIYEALSNWTHDKDQKTRFWAVEGLAHVGSDETIAHFLDVLRNDPSMDVRERAGCSMAKSGMLTRVQRMKAVPGLLELTDDPSINQTTRMWVYQALREITDETLPNDPATWRNWYSSHGSERVEKFAHSEKWALLGNS